MSERTIDFNGLMILQLTTYYYWIIQVAPHIKTINSWVNTLLSLHSISLK